MTATAFLRSHTPTLEKLAEAVRGEAPGLALLVIDIEMALAAEWIAPHAAAVALASAETGDAVAYALDARALAEILKLDGAPIEGPLHSFLACADALNAGQTRIVAVACGEIAWKLRPGPAWGLSRGLA